MAKHATHHLQSEPGVVVLRQILEDVDAAPAVLQEDVVVTVLHEDAVVRVPPIPLLQISAATLEEKELVNPLVDRLGSVVDSFCVSSWKQNSFCSGW